jgi:hypothetical protein
MAHHSIKSSYDRQDYRSEITKHKNRMVEGMSKGVIDRFFKEFERDYGKTASG